MKKPQITIQFILFYLKSKSIFQKYHKQCVFSATYFFLKTTFSIKNRHSSSLIIPPIVIAIFPLDVKTKNNPIKSWRVNHRTALTSMNIIIFVSKL